MLIIHWCFQLLLRNQRLVFLFLLFNSWAGVRELEGNTARQRAKLANGNIPYLKHHAQFMNDSWPRAGISLCFLFLWVWTLSCLAILIFPGVWSFLVVLRKSQILWVWDSTIAVLGLDANQSWGGEKNSIIHSLVWISIIIIFIIIIIIISTSTSVISTSISLVALLNCLYLNPQVSTFISFSPPILLRRKERGKQAAAWCLVAVCQLKLQEYLAFLFGFLKANSSFEVSWYFLLFLVLQVPTSSFSRHYKDTF